MGSRAPAVVSADALAGALATVRARTALRPEVAVVLGSGLGGLADEVERAVGISTEEIPGYPVSTVAGHAGRLVLGTIAGRPVLVLQGRVHLYEGHPAEAVTFPVRLAHALGARRLLLTNAAGGVNPAFGPGTLMLIADHLSFASAGTMLGDEPGAGVHPRFRGSPYDKKWRADAARVALSLRIAYRTGTYLWTAGPSYETPAEIRFFRRLGADAVGMSTAPEAVQAAALGLRVLGLSTITNAAAGLSAAPLDHAEVLAVGHAVRERLAAWVRAIIAALPDP